MTPPLKGHNSRNIGGGHVCCGSYDGFNFVAGAAAVFPACTANTMRPHALRLAVHAGALWAATAMRGKFPSEF